MEVIQDVNVRFKDAVWYGNRANHSITVYGAGGIGSWTTFLLSKLGFKVLVYDFDTVGVENIGPQLFAKNAINKSKVNAVYELRELFGNTGIVHSYAAKIGKSEGFGYMMPICVAAFDNMKARAEVFARWKELYKSTGSRTALFVDGRLNAELFELYFVKIADCDRYEKTLFADSDVEDLPCTYKSTAHFGAGIAFKICQGITNFITNVYSEVELRDIPFYYREEGLSFTNYTEL